MNFISKKIYTACAGVLIFVLFFISSSAVFAQYSGGASGPTTGGTTTSPGTTTEDDGVYYKPGDSASGGTSASSGSGSGIITVVPPGAKGGNSWVNVFVGGSTSGYGSYSGGSGNYGTSGYAGNVPNSGTAPTSGAGTIDLSAAKVNLPANTCSSIDKSKDLGSLLGYVTCMITSSVIPLIVVLSITVFLWGVTVFLMNTSDTKKRDEGKKFMIWGIVALFVIVSYWGIVRLFSDTLGFTNNGMYQEVPHLDESAADMMIQK